MAQGYRFGGCELHPTERVLLVDGAPAALGTRAFDVLLMLVEQAGELVTKDALLDRVWAGLVVEENNIQAQVSALRKLVGARAIATIPGLGYRFTAPLQVDAASARPASNATAAAPEAAALLPAVLRAEQALHGRTQELAAVLQQLSLHRLVTLVGAGGIGKTALARAAAQAWHAAGNGAVAWADLTDADDETHLCGALAEALQLRLSAAPTPTALAAAAAACRGLLVIDNAEHRADTVAALTLALLRDAPALRCLVTSQVPLKLEAERVFRVDPLAVPPEATPPAEAAGYGAIALLVDCAHAADRSFVWDAQSCAAAIDLCRRLDGLALAIKLAAARLPLLGLEGVRARLSDRLRLLAGAAHGVPGRHQTLQAALDWSHALLSPPEQTVLRRLGVFGGGCTLEAAAQVAGDGALDEWAVIDALGGLVDRSFVALQPGGALRYRLSESAKAYALDRLAEAGETEGVRRRHAECFVALADASYEAYWAEADAPWRERYGAELDNLRAALDWSAQHAPVLALRLVGSASFLFLLPGLAAEIRGRWQALQGEATRLQAQATGDTAAVLARYWLEGSRLSWGVSGSAMSELAQRAVTGYRACGDARGLYLALRCAAVGNDVAAEQAERMLDEMAALEQPSWPARLRAQRLLAQAGALAAAGHLDAECAALQTLARLARDAGLATLTAFALAGLSAAQLRRGELDAALASGREVLAGPRHLYGNHVLQALAAVASALLLRGETADAGAAIAEFAELSCRRGWEWFGRYADMLALLAAQQGRDPFAAQLMGYAEAQRGLRGPLEDTAARLLAATRRIVALRLDEAELARLAAEGQGWDEATVARLLPRT